MSDLNVGPGHFPYPITKGPSESRYLTWVRNHSNYLTPRGFLDYLRAAAVMLRGILVNSVTLLPLVLVGALLLAGWHDVTEHRFLLTRWTALAVIVWFLLFPVVIRLFKVRQQRQSIRYGTESTVKVRDRYERMFGGALLLLVVAVAVDVFPYVLDVFHSYRGPGRVREWLAGGAAASSLAFLSGSGKLLDSLGDAKKKLAVWLIGLVGALLPVLVSLYVAERLVYPDHADLEGGWMLLLGIVGTLTLGTVMAIVYSVRRVGFNRSQLIFRLLILVLATAAGVWLAWKSATPGSFDPDWLFIIAATVVLWLYSWLSVDVNLTSMSGFYRDRLASAYLGGQDTSGDVDIEQDINLGDICQYEHGSTAPYHLVNTALNLQGSKDIGIRDRNSDFFFFSKRFIGGRKTGFTRSEDLEAVFPQMDLATAMAISAAAAAPNMGRNTSPPLVAIMTLLNVRLGYWIPNPGRLTRWVHAVETRDPAVAGPRPAKEEWSFADVFEVELGEIQARWRNAYPDDVGASPEARQRVVAPRTEPTPEHGLVGIAFSGGGIRSATVNMGIAQALHEQGVFNHADYMSTVSGGGYLGSSLSTLMRAKNLSAPVPEGSKLQTLSHRFNWRIPPRALLREMFSKLDETSKWVNLSDGGHIENLATMELLRRRCKFIITGDAEADPNMHFGGLATLIRFARIDLGVDIDIDVRELHLRSGELDEGLVSQQHFAVGRITYPGESEHGYLLYFKSSVTGDEDEVISEYRARKSTFPHESTADQFFDEGQFEAYRALGEHMARKALTLHDGRKDTYAALESWFRRLEESLPHRWDGAAEPAPAEA
jgi:hypothetical protein